MHTFPQTPFGVSLTRNLGAQPRTPGPRRTQSEGGGCPSARGAGGGLGTSRRPGGAERASDRSGGHLRARLPAASAACALSGSAPPSGPILRSVPSSPRCSPSARFACLVGNSAKPAFDGWTFDFQTSDAMGSGVATCRGARVHARVALLAFAPAPFRIPLSLGFA